MPYPPGTSSLPSRPQWAAPGQQTPYQNAEATQNLFASSAYSSHYAQAYMQAQGIQAAPMNASMISAHNLPSTSKPHHYRSNTSHANKLPRYAQNASTWYQPGHNRCTYKDCQFAGAPKALEIHRMDRHLIFPPGWSSRAKKDDWDADPSLKGKRIPIQGTNLNLDTPEALEAWKDERRKRFPTASRVDDKKRKMEEAVARGQLTVEDMGVRPEKRRRTDETQGRDRQNARGTGRGRGRGQAVQRPSNRLPPSSSKFPHQMRPEVPPAEESSSSGDDGEPEIVSSKGPVLAIATSPAGNPSIAVPALAPAAPAKPTEKRPLQPKKPLPNPFNNRAPLLRNLILPEIRVTVSNLSQAIRFLVDNDFLKDVELKPGQAEDRPIHVISSTETGA